MFESSRRLERDIADGLKTILGLVGSRYACLVDARGIRFEASASEATDRDMSRLRGLVEEKREALLALPRDLESSEPMQDMFEDWNAEELFVAIINGRIALVVAGPEAEELRTRSRRLIRALTDRLLRYDSLYRADPKGRGFFFGRPRLDSIVISRAAD